jgi:hypothetical protein
VYMLTGMRKNEAKIIFMSKKNPYEEKELEE